MRIEVNGLERVVAVRQRQTGADDLVDDDGAVGLLQPLDEDVELVALREVAAHVDLVLEDVGERPRQLMTCRGRQDADAALIEGVVQARTNDTANGQRVDQFGVGGLNDERRENEICRLEARSGDDDGLHCKDLLLLEARCKPNGDRCQGRHDYITNRSNALMVLQSICLRMNVGISISLRSCSGDDRSRSGVTAGLLVGVFLFGSSSGALVAPFPRGGRSGITGAPRTIGEGVAMSTAGAWAVADWGLSRSNPVAMTVTRISPCIAGSCTAPKMISASSPTASWMISLI